MAKTGSERGRVAQRRRTRRAIVAAAAELLAHGKTPSVAEVAEAAEVLARPHRLAGEVVHGDHRGRELGFPTANLGTPVEGLVPADGVYAGWMLRCSLPEDDPDRLLPATA